MCHLMYSLVCEYEKEKKIYLKMLFFSLCVMHAHVLYSIDEFVCKVFYA